MFIIINIIINININVDKNNYKKNLPLDNKNYIDIVNVFDIVNHIMELQVMDSLADTSIN